MASNALAVLTVALLFSSCTAISSPFSHDYDYENPIESLAIRNYDESAYRLPSSTVPEAYDVILKIDPNNNSSFSGEVLIQIEAKAVTDKIVLHANYIAIKNVTVQAVGSNINLALNYELSDNDTHFLEINLSQNTILNAKYLVDIEFDGKFGLNMEGIYLSSYVNAVGDTRYLATTQFQPVSAREAFPCYDEPALKATFKIHIYAPIGYHSLTNMDVTNSSLPPIEGFIVTSFEETPKMSTYLLAFIVSDFDYKSNKVHGPDDHDKKFRVYSRPNAIDTVDYALDFAQKSINDLEKYLEFDFRLDKLDKAAIPDFAAGAMENWGLVTYREEYLLFKENTSTTRDKFNIATIISHENAHMWFGNEVSPAWWGYLWLNEGFATYFEYYSTDRATNYEWRFLEQFVATFLQGVMRSDATLNTNPMSSSVATPEEIDRNFNGIAYDKSGSVIRMFSHILGEEVFREGLVHYLDSLQLGVTEPIKLYTSLQNVSEGLNLLPPNVTVGDVFSTWATQSGFPLVTATREGNTSIVNVSQKRYFADKSLNSTETWWVPLTWTTKTDRNMQRTKAQRWLGLERNGIIDVQYANEWFLLNTQQMGYYRVMYDGENWERLTEGLKSPRFDNIHHINRAQLLDDSFEFARSERMSFNVSLDLMMYLKEEVDYIPWITANRILNTLDPLMPAAESHDLYQLMKLQMNAKSVEKLGYVAVTDETPVDKFHRIVALNIDCNARGYESLLAANSMLEQLKNGSTTQPDPDLVSFTYCCGLRLGDEEQFEFVLEKYSNASNQASRTLILNSLGCSGNSTLLRGFLQMSISNDSMIRDQDRHIIITSVLNNGDTWLALDFFTKNFNEFKQRNPTRTVTVIGAFGGRIIKDDEIETFVQFKDDYNSTFSDAERAAAQRSLNTMESNKLWLNNALIDIEPWLNDNIFYSSASVSQISFLILGLSSIVAIFYRP